MKLLLQPDLAVEFLYMAVGLMCRQHLQLWGPKNVRLAGGVENLLLKLPPRATPDSDYHFFANLVMFQVGDERWGKWNQGLRNHLTGTQIRDDAKHTGSWSAVGDPFKDVGGRLMVTSFALLNLEIYYRQAPLYWRELPMN